MGGYGSGRTTWRGVLDHYYSLDVNRFHQKGYVGRHAWTSWQWSHEGGEVVASIGITFDLDGLELRYTVNPRSEDAREMRYRVEYDWTSCTYGGTRPWFICPNGRCSRRVGKLYLCGTYFVCRHCTRASYASQRETPSDRMLRRAQKIRRRLGASMNLTESVWRKPKGMHWRTFWRFREEAEEADYRSLTMAVQSLGIRVGG